MKISVIGCGYVGLSNAIVLSKHHKVSIVDIDIDKINRINSGFSPIKEEQFLKPYNRVKKNISGTTNIEEGIKEAKFVLVCVPTPLDEKTNNLDISTIEEVVKEVVKSNNDAYIVIKSTLPIGVTESLSEKYNSANIIYSPEFLREKHSLEDINHPYRLVIGIDKKDKKNILIAREYASLMIANTLGSRYKIKIIGNKEAEATKLFSNAYLSMRLTFFNELDRVAYEKDINIDDIISSICLDPRIGDKYNTPNKEGFSGKCLPKDLDQVIAESNSELFKAVKKVNSKNKK